MLHLTLLSCVRMKRHAAFSRGLSTVPGGALHEPVSTGSHSAIRYRGTMPGYDARRSDAQM